MRGSEGIGCYDDTDGDLAGLDEQEWVAYVTNKASWIHGASSRDPDLVTSLP